MSTFAAYAANFEAYPSDGEAAHHLAPLFMALGRVNFSLRVKNPAANQGQLASDFDTALENALRAGGATTFELPLPPGVPQELDFAFSFGGRTVAVEVEKSNREKILRDFLKCHIYLHTGANYAVVVLPKNWAHTHGVSNLFEFGVQRYNECRAYGFGTAANLGKILLLGFDQYEALSNRLHSDVTREEMRTAASARPSHP